MSEEQSPFEKKLQDDRQVQWLIRHLVPEREALAMTDGERISKYRSIKEAISKFKRPSSGRAWPLNRFLDSGVPSRHRFATIEITSGWHDTLFSIAESARSGNGFLIAMLGGRGTGKTQIAAELIRECCLVSECRYTTAADFFRDIRSSYGAMAETSEKAVFERYYKPALLVIDEVHQRGETNAENNALTQIIDRRYSNQLDTLLIANQTKEEFSRSIGPSVISRINETGQTMVCNWTSFRERK